MLKAGQSRGGTVFWGKAKKIEALVLKHLGQVDVALDAFHKAIVAYVVDGDIKRAKALALETHKAEGEADDIRREVEAELLGGALLATSRRDILEIIEQVDRLANSGEATLDSLLLERIEFPETVVDYVAHIVSETVEIVAHVDQAILMLFRDPAAAIAHSREIETREGHVDQLERQALKTVFMMDIELARKIQLRDFIHLLVEISDRAEDLSDRIDVMIAERRF